MHDKHLQGRRGTLHLTHLSPVLGQFSELLLIQSNATFTSVCQHKHMFEYMVTLRPVPGRAFVPVYD